MGQRRLEPKHDLRIVGYAHLQLKLGEYRAVWLCEIRWANGKSKPPPGLGCWRSNNNRPSGPNILHPGIVDQRAFYDWCSEHSVSMAGDQLIHLAGRGWLGGRGRQLPVW